MFGIIKWLIVNVVNLLPDSPFSQMLDSMEVDRSYMQYMNWFLPFDYIGVIMLAWLNCMFIYFIFLLIRWIIFKKIIGHLTDFSFSDLINGKIGN